VPGHNVRLVISVRVGTAFGSKKKVLQGCCNLERASAIQPSWAYSSRNTGDIPRIQQLAVLVFLSIKNVFVAVRMTKAIIQTLHLSQNGMHCNFVTHTIEFLDFIYFRTVAILSHDCTKKQAKKKQLLLSLLMICSFLALFLDLELSEFHDLYTPLSYILFSLTHSYLSFWRCGAEWCIKITNKFLVRKGPLTLKVHVC